MRIVKGYSEEVAHANWIKGDVEVDETDLYRIKVENNINVDLTQGQIYAILSLEAEKLVTVLYARDLSSKGLEIPQTVKSRISSLGEALKSKIEEIVG